MKIGIDSRFCEHCQKDVIDFTEKSREEILKIILTNRDRRLCGRFRKSQLDYTPDELLITVQALSKNPKNTNLAFYLLTMGTLLLSSCSNDEPKESTSSTEIVDATQKMKGDSMHKLFSKQEMDTVECDGKHKPVKHKPDEVYVEEVERIVSGELIAPELEITPPDVDNNEPYKFADVMPEFIGGIDSLRSYITKNLKFPARELEQNITATVYVRFVVDKTGKVINLQILRAAAGTNNFDEEVIKLMNNMPLWKPGSHKGENVDVEFNLPIKFKLK
ncbi:MAG TPA: energy transducer TonB [Bacteroidia bacterium]|jgi:TonB family protein|nr:energy transducer TonB [Bacteroidia bacterium]